MLRNWQYIVGTFISRRHLVSKLKLSPVAPVLTVELPYICRKDV